MLWKLLAAVFSLFFSGPIDSPVPPPPHNASEWGPVSWEDAVVAMKALHTEEGDMRFSPDFEEAGIKDKRFRWPNVGGNFIVPVYIHPSVQPLIPLINRAIQQYHDKTPIRFVQRTNQRDFLYVFQDNGCYSYVGRVGGGQKLSLGRGCEYVGTIVHEFGHAIGLYHEHQRSDRDNYLTVWENNVVKDQGHNFDKTDPAKELIFTSYDYTSIMHYGNYAFSKRPGQLKTMEAKNGTPLKEPYDRPGLNNNDIETIKKLYEN